jgi:hypothetical protein
MPSQAGNNNVPKYRVKEATENFDADKDFCHTKSGF